MPMDIAIGLIILFSMIAGARRGFAMTLINCMHWFLSLILAYVFCDDVKAYIIDNTTLDDTINQIMVNSMNSNFSGNTLYMSIPTLFENQLKSMADGFLYKTASSMTDLLITILSFLVILIGIKIACFLLSRLFSKKYNQGLVGFFDGLIGLLLGFVRGTILAFIFLAFLVPFITLIYPELAPVIMEYLDQSYIAGILYENNILLVIVNGIFN
jgi:uncharacterized membrane protein required for colicin V production